MGNPIYDKPEAMPAEETRERVDWFRLSTEVVKEQDRDQFLALADTWKWEPLTKGRELPMSQGLALQAMIGRGQKVTHIMWDHAAFWGDRSILGVLCHFKDMSVKIYAADSGEALIFILGVGYARVGKEIV